MRKMEELCQAYQDIMLTGNPQASSCLGHGGQTQTDEKPQAMSALKMPSSQISSSSSTSSSSSSSSSTVAVASTAASASAATATPTSLVSTLQAPPLAVKSSGYDHHHSLPADQHQFFLNNSSTNINTINLINSNHHQHNGHLGAASAHSASPKLVKKYSLRSRIQQQIAHSPLIYSTINQQQQQQPQPPPTVNHIANNGSSLIQSYFLKTQNGIHLANTALHAQNGGKALLNSSFSQNDDHMHRDEYEASPSMNGGRMLNSNGQYLKNGSSALNRPISASNSNLVRRTSFAEQYHLTHQQSTNNNNACNGSKNNYRAGGSHVSKQQQHQLFRSRESLLINTASSANQNGPVNGQLSSSTNSLICPNNDPLGVIAFNYCDSAQLLSQRLMQQQKQQQQQQHAFVSQHKSYHNSKVQNAASSFQQQQQQTLSNFNPTQFYSQYVDRLIIPAAASSVPNVAAALLNAAAAATQKHDARPLRQSASFRSRPNVKPANGDLNNPSNSASSLNNSFRLDKASSSSVERISAEPPSVSIRYLTPTKSLNEEEPKTTYLVADKFRNSGGSSSHNNNFMVSPSVTQVEVRSTFAGGNQNTDSSYSFKEHEPLCNEIELNTVCSDDNDNNSITVNTVNYVPSTSTTTLIDVISSQSDIVSKLPHQSKMASASASSSSSSSTSTISAPDKKLLDRQIEQTQSKLKENMLKSLKKMSSSNSSSMGILSSAGKSAGQHYHSKHISVGHKQPGLTTIAVSSSSTLSNASCSSTGVFSAALSAAEAKASQQQNEPAGGVMVIQVEQNASAPQVAKIENLNDSAASSSSSSLKSICPIVEPPAIANNQQSLPEDQEPAADEPLTKTNSQEPDEPVQSSENEKAEAPKVRADDGNGEDPQKEELPEAGQSSWDSLKKPKSIIAQTAQHLLFKATGGGQREEARQAKPGGVSFNMVPTCINNPPPPPPTSMSKQISKLHEFFSSNNHGSSGQPGSSPPPRAISPTLSLMSGGQLVNNNSLAFSGNNAENSSSRQISSGQNSATTNKDLFKRKFQSIVQHGFHANSGSSLKRNASMPSKSSFLINPSGMFLAHEQREKQAMLSRRKQLIEGSTQFVDIKSKIKQFESIKKDSVGLVASAAASVISQSSSNCGINNSNTIAGSASNSTLNNGATAANSSRASLSSNSPNNVHNNSFNDPIPAIPSAVTLGAIGAVTSLSNPITCASSSALSNGGCATSSGIYLTANSTTSIEQPQPYAMVVPVAPQATPTIAKRLIIPASSIFMNPATASLTAVSNSLPTSLNSTNQAITPTVYTSPVSASGLLMKGPILVASSESAQAQQYALVQNKKVLEDYFPPSVKVRDLKNLFESSNQSLTPQ